MIAELARADLDRILNAPLDELRPATLEEAESYLAWSFEDSEHDRMEVLCSKNNAGTITPQEREELERYADLGTRISILQSRSRLLLRSLIPTTS